MKKLRELENDCALKYKTPEELIISNSTTSTDSKFQDKNLDEKEFVVKLAIDRFRQDTHDETHVTKFIQNRDIKQVGAMRRQKETKK